MVEWIPEWAEETCVCVASGPSAKGVPLELAKDAGARVITANNSWELAPWADIIYACDGRWWRKYMEDVAHLPALKVTSDKRAADELDLNYIKVNKPDDRALMQKGVIGWGGNSGFHLINMAMQFGCARIVLVGYDMTIKHGNHWHKDHTGDLTNPTAGNVSRWRRAVDGIAPVAEKYDIEIINCSMVSALQNYPKMPFKDAIA